MTVAGGSTSAGSPAPTTPTVVGIGASAGGLAALEAFFRSLPTPPAPGIAFVVVQHLSPDQVSCLAELVQRVTKLAVLEIVDGQPVQPDTIHVLTPNHELELERGVLRLVPVVEPRGRRLPIDRFFRSLANDQRERAVAIVLSGAGSDGAQGARAIRQEDGLVLAQAPSSTAFPGMPQSALATGGVAIALPPEELGAALIAHLSRSDATLRGRVEVPSPETAEGLSALLRLVRARTGHDFAGYKTGTIQRRVERRMAANQVERFADYLALLGRSPAELDALFDELLIGVTEFFRDPAEFERLEREVLPALFADRPPDTPFRAWSVGCSTGEEAYSLAILLQERLEALKQNVPIQLFATDLRAGAIAVARAGRYPAAIADHVSPERLARWFVADPATGGYRIHRTIRDLCVFSVHDVLRDPAFLRLDLLVCRNLLIYLGPELQRRLVAAFHYALRPGGALFVGTAEGVGDLEARFAPVDRAARILRRSVEPAQRPRIVHPHTFPAEPVSSSPVASAAVSRSPNMRELVETTLLQSFTPAAILVRPDGDVLYVHGRTGAWLEPAAGEAPVANVLRMAREGLRGELTTALGRAAATLATVRAPGLRVLTNGHHTLVDLEVLPLAGPSEAPNFLVVLRPGAGLASTDEAVALPEDEGQPQTELVALRRALLARDQHLRVTQDALETTNEELTAANEELRSLNEELQSANEELETSKEELQSLNEELATINAELNGKVQSLSQANDDLNNLLAGTGIGTLFVDHQLRILRFTPNATALVHLIAADVGRPLAHVVSNLVGYDALVAETKGVLDTLVPCEREVRTPDGRAWSMRIQPYRTLEHVIVGAVISFQEITDAVRKREALEKANEGPRVAPTDGHAR